MDMGTRSENSGHWLTSRGVALFYVKQDAMEFHDGLSLMAAQGQVPRRETLKARVTNLHILWIYHS